MCWLKFKSIVVNVMASNTFWMTIETWMRFNWNSTNESDHHKLTCIRHVNEFKLYLHNFISAVIGFSLTKNNKIKYINWCEQFLAANFVIWPNMYYYSNVSQPVKWFAAANYIHYHLTICNGIVRKPILWLKNGERCSLNPSLCRSCSLFPILFIKSLSLFIYKYLSYSIRLMRSILNEPFALLCL